MPDGGTILGAILLVLVGAMSKSAIVPFHFWLPSAMAAPTPGSAYLHAAAMVRSRAAWLKSTKIRSPRSSFHQFIVTLSGSRRSSSRPAAMTA